MNKSPLVSLAAAMLLALASFDAPAQAQWSGVAQRQGAPVTPDVLQHTRWIADGRDDAPRKVYVFLDANCVYCAKFWADARPWVDGGKVQLRYILVAVIAPTSAGKAATLLGDPDPAKRLAAFERSHAFGVARMMQGGPRHSMQDASLPPTAPVPEAVARGLQASEGLMNALNLRGTPGIVFQRPDGQLVALGGMPANGLGSILGPL
ncbi:thiol:disulfide interchange protein DsbG [Scleromatobacter humisilvae]|uniref:Thiol:disulfide interchange protein DsbG n=1 Tax=Scleromatobacter humisilvae TaxID=2897159 RepID=A0A9X1YND5_9BURK|nr:thiol:disulfide interchange protein DsbG [Scleromatobacter humisilvae]MCK9687562.1 thiol:disulfide interchange protein DsbG [Scleromatobacter humisilvae]